MAVKLPARNVLCQCLGAAAVYWAVSKGLHRCLVQEQVRRLEERLAGTQQMAAEGGMQQPAAAAGGIGAARPDPVMQGHGITA